jgi:hypothetical protein
MDPKVVGASGMDGEVGCLGSLYWLARLPNPKLEGRSPKEIRILKSEKLALAFAPSKLSGSS